AASPGADATNNPDSSDPRRATASADTANQTALLPSPVVLTEDDEQLTPTGSTSADQSPASAVTAMSIRQALDNDPSLAKEDVQVTTKIVLRGTVESD